MERNTSWLTSLFRGSQKGAGITTTLPGATVSRVGTVEVGAVALEGYDLSIITRSVAGALRGVGTVAGTLLGSLTKVGIWSLPLMLNGDSSSARGYDIPLTGQRIYQQINQGFYFIAE